MRGLLILSLAVLLSGCITTSESIFAGEESPSVALKKRVELARAYIGQGNWENAKRNLKLAAEIDPKNAEVYEAFALVYQSTGEFELAEENFQLAINLDKQFSRARNNYASFLFTQQEFVAAEQQLEIVIRDTLYSGRPQAFTNLGLCRIRLGKTEEAVEALQRALTMQQRNPVALLALAEVLYDMGQYEQAQGYYVSYRTTVVQPSAGGLWVGIQLARVLDLPDDQASLELSLRHLYPNSPEARALEQGRVNAGAVQ